MNRELLRSRDVVRHQAGLGIPRHAAELHSEALASVVGVGGDIFDTVDIEDVADSGAFGTAVLYHAFLFHVTIGEYTIDRKCGVALRGPAVVTLPPRTLVMPLTLTYVAVDEHVTDRCLRGQCHDDFFKGVQRTAGCENSIGSPGTTALRGKTAAGDKPECLPRHGIDPRFGGGLAVGCRSDPYGIRCALLHRKSLL